MSKSLIVLSDLVFVFDGYRRPTVHYCFSLPTHFAVRLWPVKGGGQHPDLADLAECADDA